MKLRIKFSKHGSMKFIGHLDIMRYFQKAIRRSEIDVAYSEGFSPHQKMSFAAPLGVGLYSNGEYFDVEVNSLTSTDDILKRLNDTMNDEIEVLSVILLPDGAKKAMSLVGGADYTVVVKDDYNELVSSESSTKYTKINPLTLCENIENFYELSEIVVLKKTKKSEREIDIKPLIHEFGFKNENGNPVIFMIVNQGSENNLKPELVIEQLCKFSGVEYNEYAFQYTREDTLWFDEAKNEFRSLDDVE